MGSHKRQGNTLIFKRNPYKPVKELLGWSFDDIYASDFEFKRWFDANVERMYVKLSWQNNFQYLITGTDAGSN